LEFGAGFAVVTFEVVVDGVVGEAEVAADLGAGVAGEVAADDFVVFR
jgi:hypothetical protein